MLTVVCSVMLAMNADGGGDGPPQELLKKLATMLFAILDKDRNDRPIDSAMLVVTAY